MGKWKSGRRDDVVCHISWTNAANRAGTCPESEDSHVQQRRRRWRRNQRRDSTRGTSSCRRWLLRGTGNEGMPKIITNNAIDLFFKLLSAFCWFQTITVSDCFLIKLLPHILFPKNMFIFSIGNGQPREPVLCQLYRHTFVPYRDYVSRRNTIPECLASGLIA